jgi:hypothetical protein
MSNKWTKFFDKILVQYSNVRVGTYVDLLVGQYVYFSFERNNHRQAGRASRGWEDNIKTDLTKIKLVSHK